MLFDISGGVEPYFALSYYYKGILGGQELTYVNKHLRKALEKRNLYSEELMKKIIHEGSLQKISGNTQVSRFHIIGIPQDIKNTFVTSMDISAEDHILMQSAFQESCDNAISKTINFSNSATTKDIEKVQKKLIVNKVRRISLLGNQDVRDALCIGMEVENFKCSI